MPRQSSFRFYAKNVFLTYTQCPCPKEQLLELLQSLLQLACQPYYILVARELHEDGNPHLHAMVQCTKKIQTFNPRFFDLIRTNGRIYHPNIENSTHQQQVDSIYRKGASSSNGENFHLRGEVLRKTETNSGREYLAKQKRRNNSLLSAKKDVPPITSQNTPN